MNRSLTWSSLIASLILVSASASCSPRESQTEPFGVFLRPETTNLQHEVEALYGRSVRTERPSTLEVNAEAIVTDDGTPVIRIRESVAPTEVRVAHELLHLQMVSEGFAYSIEPRFHWAGVTLENLALFNRTAEVVHNGILHWMFYPKLRAMGVNPSEEFRTELSQTFFIGAALDDTMTEQDLALNFFKASLEIDDPQITERLAAHYVANGWQGPLDTGRSMAELVVNGRPDSPQREVDLFLACMDRLFKDTAEFSVLARKDQRRGAVEVFTLIISVGVKKIDWN